MSNKDLGNKQFLSSAFTSSTVQIAFLLSIMVINIDKVGNFNNVRRRSSFSSKVFFRSTSSILYHKRIVINNNLSDEEFKEPIDSSQLSYKDNSQERNCIIIATNLVLS